MQRWVSSNAAAIGAVTGVLSLVLAVLALSSTAYLTSRSNEIAVGALREAQEANMISKDLYVAALRAELVRLDSLNAKYHEKRLIEWLDGYSGRVSPVLQEAAALWSSLEKPLAQNDERFLSTIVNHYGPYLSTDEATPIVGSLPDDFREWLKDALQ